jgi:formamidopyrimidine-DNA glycosylase
VPELPELQAHAERLTALLAGQRLARFVALSFTAMKTARPDPASLAGEPLEEVDRVGKYLLVRFPSATFVVHLMQGGRLSVDVKQTARPRGGLARWSFDAGDALLLSEQAKEKRAGIWLVADDPLTQPPLQGLGPDAASIALDALQDRLRARSMRLHGFLRDQRAVSGIGRRLASEICHRAQLSPFAPTGRLDAREVAQLHGAIAACIDDALTAERSREEMSSSAERPGRVYRRTGEACPECGDTVRAVTYASYTVNYCPTCQTGGRVLADNTTSRFLK